MHHGYRSALTVGINPGYFLTIREFTAGTGKYSVGNQAPGSRPAAARTMQCCDALDTAVSLALWRWPGLWTNSDHVMNFTDERAEVERMRTTPDKKPRASFLPSSPAAC
jgi:hypothetical protein